MRRKQRELDADSRTDAEAKWRNARKTLERNGVIRLLQDMAGHGCRCMYCSDSLGADVDHFWPKARYREKTFVWENMLLACSVCNRCKGDRLALGENEAPLLIDPTAENPWDCLHYDSATGFLTARFVAGTGYDPRGEHTTDQKSLPLNHQATIEGRRREQSAMFRALGEFRQRYRSSHGSREKRQLITALLRVVGNLNQHDLAYWHFCSRGRTERPIQSFQNEFPDIFRALASLHPV